MQEVNKWKKKVKKPAFWTKLVATGIGIAVATGNMPAGLEQLVGEQVSVLVGTLIAAGFGIWLGKDDEKEKKEIENEK
jgi:uncharacterized membrane protein AbrB (regulator of aidB expression)